MRPYQMSPRGSWGSRYARPEYREGWEFELAEREPDSVLEDDIGAPLDEILARWPACEDPSGWEFDSDLRAQGGRLPMLRPEHHEAIAGSPDAYSQGPAWEAALAADIAKARDRSRRTREGMERAKREQPAREGQKWRKWRKWKREIEYSTAGGAVENCRCAECERRRG